MITFLNMDEALGKDTARVYMPIQQFLDNC